MIDLEAIYLESAANKPIALMYSEESETLRRYFINFAKSKVGNSYQIIDINLLGLNDDKQIKKLLSKPMEEVSS